MLSLQVPTSAVFPEQLCWGKAYCGDTGSEQREIKLAKNKVEAGRTIEGIERDKKEMVPPPPL